MYQQLDSAYGIEPYTSLLIYQIRMRLTFSIQALGDITTVSRHHLLDAIAEHSFQIFEQRHHDLCHSDIHVTTV